MLEVLPARLVEKFADARQLLDDWLVLWNFAIEDAQRIGHRSTLTVRIHLVFDRVERFAQSFVVLCAIVGAAD